MSDDLYHAAIMDRAKAAAGDHRLSDPDATATVDNPLCGDRVTMDVRMDGARIAALGYRVRGCALCQASTSLVAEILADAAREGAEEGETVLRALLDDGVEPLERWSSFAMFRPVGAYRSRHGCVLLPLAALRKALAV